MAVKITKYTLRVLRSMKTGLPLCTHIKDLETELSKGNRDVTT